MAAPKKRWIQGATKSAHGQFAAKAKRAGKTTHAYAVAHQHDKGVTGRQARLALTLEKMRKKK